MKQHLIRSAVLVALGGAALPALAQSSGERAQLEEIVVTASKRAQTLQEIPIAVSTLGAEELQIRKVANFADYLPSIPGVQLNDAGSLYNKAISIRGVTDGSNSYLTQSPVATYLDETPLTLSQGAFNLDYSMISVDRVTVIKGPHSTLYGAASLGGTIKVETTKPSLTDFDARARVYFTSVDGGDSGFTAAATVSGPAIENRAAFELTGYSVQTPGYIDDPSRGKEDINGLTTTGGRLAGRFAPTDKLLIDATFYYQKTDLDSISTFAPDQVGDLQSRPLLFDQPNTDDLKLGSLVVRYQFAAAELVSATSYYDREGMTLQDYSRSFFNLGIPGSVVEAGVESPAKVFSQELRLASTGESRLTWLAGLFYSDEDYTEIATFDHSFVGPLFSGNLHYQYETMAVFGEVGFDLTERLNLTAGGRYTDYSADTRIDLGGAFAVPGSGVDRSDSDNDFSPRVALNYDYGDGSVYVQASKGFRLGQANVPIVALPTDNVPTFYKSDSLWNYEIGAKTSWLDRRLQLNAALYYIDWTDVQMTLTAGTGFTYVSNAGSAEVTGAELESTALLTDSLVWTVGMSYINAELAEDVPSVAPEGTKMPGVPEFTFNTSLQQDFTLFGNDSYARVDYLHYGEYDNSFPTGVGPVEKNGDYDKLDLRAGMFFGKFEVSLFGTNLLDERPAISRNNASGDQEVSTILPRSYGIGFTYDF